jgi:hypothetical protein
MCKIDFKHLKKQNIKLIPIPSWFLIKEMMNIKPKKLFKKNKNIQYLNTSQYLFKQREKYSILKHITINKNYQTY